MWEGWLVLFIVDDVLLLFFEIDMVLRSCWCFIEFMYWCDFEVMVDWIGVIFFSFDVCVLRFRFDFVEIVGNFWLLVFGDIGVWVYMYIELMMVCWIVFFWWFKDGWRGKMLVDVGV